MLRKMLNVVAILSFLLLTTNVIAQAIDVKVHVNANRLTVSVKQNDGTLQPFKPADIVQFAGFRNPQIVNEDDFFKIISNDLGNQLDFDPKKKIIINCRVIPDGEDEPIVIQWISDPIGTYVTQVIIVLGDDIKLPERGLRDFSLMLIALPEGVWSQIADNYGAILDENYGRRMYPYFINPRELKESDEISIVLMINNPAPPGEDDHDDKIYYFVIPTPPEITARMVLRISQDGATFEEFPGEPGEFPKRKTPGRTVKPGGKLATTWGKIKSSG